VERSGPGREIAGFFLLGAGALLFLALATFDAHDYPARAWPPSDEARNGLGGLGRDVAAVAFDWFGVLPSYLAAGIAALSGLALVRGGRAPRAAPAAQPTAGGAGRSATSIRVSLAGATPPSAAGPRVPGAAEGGAPGAPHAPWAALAAVRPLGALAALLAAATVEHLLQREGIIPPGGFPGRNPGGYWGAFLGSVVLRNFDPAVGYGLALAVGSIGAALAADLDIGKVVRKKKPSPPPAQALPPLPTGEGEHPGSESAASGPDPAPPVPPLVRVARREPPAVFPAAPPDPALAPPPRGLDPAAGAPAPACPPDPDADPEPPPEPPAAQERQLLLPAFDALPDTGDLDSDGYTVPPLTMLTPAEVGPIEEYETAMREKAEVLQRTLQDFKIDARVVAVERGPNITQYELELAPGVKVHRILSLDDDLALALKAASIRIIAPIPGKSTVGVEVPNQDQDIVRLRELLESDEYGKKEYAIPLFLGKDSTGNPLIADLTRMPHLLLAGATGSGKSVCMNTIILSILMTKKPSQVKMILIDPKMVELSLYEHIPHLLAPVVTDMRKAPSVLEWAVNKMEERYGLLSRVEVRHIKNYNALGAAEIARRLAKTEEDLAREKIPARLPYIVLVIDEFADLMCVARKEVEGSIIRLAQKSRAVGIHLILATQRPTADVITGLIKSNMPCRIAFQVASKVDSRTIIDKNGAEMLVGQGDMLYLPPGTANVIRAQGTYVSEDEVKAVVKFCKAAAEPQFHPELVRWEGGESASDGAEGEDELFDQAVRIVLETQRGSASLLQRRLEIGYTRASRLIDIMTERGILGPFKGSKAREILLTLEDWEKMKAREAGEEV
jgi:hypothetical protein